MKYDIKNEITELPDDPFIYKGIEYKPYSMEPEICEKCSNNPKNGGSGICNCTLPYANYTC